MNSLNDKSTRARLHQVDPAHKKTFHWLFDPQIVSFTGWLRDTDVTKSPIYWIQGKPGSGKSTIMNFAMRDVRILESLNADTGDTWTLAAFFFHDRGLEMQKTLVGMLQGILHSILDQLPALLPFVVPSYIYLVREQRTRIPDWDLDQLLCTFRSIFEQREVQVRILFLLDALDEHHGDNETLISLIKELTDKTDGDYVAVKWCLASRSWTIFAEHFGNCPGFSIHDYTKQDVRTYVESQLNYSSHGQQSPPDQDRLAAIIDTVTRKALGVFIWVRIVVDRMAMGLRDGTPYATLETQLEEMPQQLSELYTDTLKRVEPEYATEAYIMLQIAFCSLRPLPLESFMASLVYNYERLRQPTVYDIEIAQDPVFIPHEDPGHQLRRIASRSGGLLETVVTVSTSADVDQEDGTSTLFVQFIHQTVKEYVQRRQDHLGLVDVLPTVLRENGNSFLLRSCEISSDERICCIKKDVFIYAKFAEDTMASVTTVIVWKSNGKPRTVRVTSAIIEHIFTSPGLFDIYWWIREPPINVVSAQDPNPGEMYEFSLGLAVAANLLHYINDAYINSTAPENLSVRLLCIAAAGLDIDTGSRKVDIDRMIRSILVKRPATIHQDIAKINSLNWRVLSEKENITARHSRGFLLDERLGILNKPLPWMIKCQALSRRNEDTRLSVARTLLQSGADANDLLYQNGNRACSLVEYCVRYESAGFVRLLFEYGADPGPNWATLGRWPLLRFARIRRDGEILQTLRDFGFDDDTSVTDDTDGAPSWSAFVACGLMLAASSGGVSAAVTLSGSRNGRDQFRLFH